MGREQPATAPPGAGNLPGRSGAGSPESSGYGQRHRGDGQHRASDGQQPTQSAEVQEERQGELGQLPNFAIVPRFGVLVFGTGRQSVSCEGNCATEGDVDFNHDYETSLLLRADFMHRVVQSLRVGVGIAYGTQSDVVPVGRSEAEHWASDLVIHLAVDYPLALLPGFWIVPGGHVGPMMMFPGADLKRMRERARVDCQADGYGAECDTFETEPLGVAAGLELGVMVAVAPAVRPRLEFGLQYHWASLGSIQHPSEDRTVDWTTDAVRGYLLVGFELR